MRTDPVRRLVYHRRVQLRRCRVLPTVFCLFAALALHAHARAQPLHAALAQAGQIRVDGDLGEWRALPAQGLGDDPTGSIEARFAYDDSGLYVGARVHDDVFVRSVQPSSHEDALVLMLGLPEAGRVRGSELWLFAGQLGRTRAQIMLAESGGPAHALAAPAQIVEGPLSDGYTVEAYVPWRLLPGGLDYRFARAALRLHDVDHAGAAAHELASTRETEPARWPWLDFDGGVAAAVANFLRVKNLTSTAPKLDWVGVLGGDAHVERVLVVGTYLVRSGDGARFAFEDLPVSSAADVRSAQLVDLTGDGTPELVLLLRQRNDLGTRELWQAFDLQGEHARSLLAIETRKETRAGFVSATVSLRKAARGRGLELDVRSGEAKGLSEADYVDTAEAGMGSILLPWGPVSERVYGWDGTHWSVVRETKNPHAAVASSARPTPRDATSAPRVPTVVHEEPPGNDALIAAYRSARGVPSAARPRFSQHINLAEDARIESLMLFGKELVVVGEGFRRGVGFFYFGLPVQSPDDVQRVFTGDVTGDGRRDIFVRVRQRIGDVQREILLGYTFAGEALTPILAVEVRRARGTDSVGNVVALVRAGLHFALEVKPGVARGWSADSYPFSADSQDSFAPLLLPWQDAAVRYRFDGKVLVSSGVPAARD